jgi:hypothetical protein
MRRAAFAVLAIAAAVLFLTVCAKADPIDHKIARLRHEIIALDASLITSMSEAETKISNDVDLLHASIIAAQLETVDTQAAYREAKSLIHDLDVLRQQAIEDLTLPSNYTPPNVPVSALGAASMEQESVLASSTALVGASTEPESALASTYGDLNASFNEMSVIIAKATLEVRKKLEMLSANHENINVVEMFQLQMAMNHLSQLSEMSTSIMSAVNSSIASMARNVKS